MNTNQTEMPKAEAIQFLAYKGMDLCVCLEPDGNASVYSLPERILVVKSDLFSQCWHLAKWRIRCNLTRVKINQ